MEAFYKVRYSTYCSDRLDICDISSTERTKQAWYYLLLLLVVILRTKSNQKVTADKNIKKALPIFTLKIRHFLANSVTPGLTAFYKVRYFAYCSDCLVICDISSTARTKQAWYYLLLLLVVILRTKSNQKVTVV